MGHLEMNGKTAPELPQRWVWTTLGEIAMWGSGGTPLKSKSGYYGGNIPWVKIGDLNEGLVSTSGDMITQDGLENSSAKWVEKGSLLVAMYGSIGKLGIAGINLTTNQAIAFTKLDESLLNTKFVFWYIYSIRSELFNRSKGATQKNISQTVLKKIAFPLSPLPEQHRIVTKVEELFTRLDAGVGALTNTKAQLKRYRQSVLKSACEGRLVPTEAELARAEGRDYEPADVLLARIGKERREKWEAEKKRKGRKSAKYKEPAAPDVSGLPEGWVWATSDAIFWFVTSGSRGWAKYYSDSGPIFLRIGNLDHDSTAIDLSNIQRVQPPAGAEGNRTGIIAGDILISITADIGMIALVPEDIEEAYINQHVALARPVSTISPSYLAWFLSSQEGGQKQFLKLQRGATKMGLGLDDIRAVNIPLPPLAEQHRIVAEIERRLSVADEIEKTIDQSLKQAERMRQSILKRAFEGKLVSQDLNDKPASVLLEQIKKEKSK